MFRPAEAILRYEELYKTQLLIYKDSRINEIAIICEFF